MTEATVICDPVEDATSYVLSLGPQGRWEPAVPLPFYYGLLPWLWKRLTGWRDSYGRPAQFLGWEV